MVLVCKRHVVNVRARDLISLPRINRKNTVGFIKIFMLRIVIPVAACIL
jgi:hypothetical protein